MDELMKKKLVENQKDRIRAARLPILCSKFLEKTLERETLRTACFRRNSIYWAVWWRIKKTELEQHDCQFSLRHFWKKTLENETLRTTCFRSIVALVTSLLGSLENDLELPGDK